MEAKPLLLISGSKYISLISNPDFETVDKYEATAETQEGEVGRLGDQPFGIQRWQPITSTK